MLVHGDIHQRNALEANDGFKLVDPEGLLAEAECDLGILMGGGRARLRRIREEPVERLRADAREQAGWLAERTGLGAAAVWEWGVVERVSTGLLCIGIGLEAVGREMLALADRVSEA